MSFYKFDKGSRMEVIKTRRVLPAPQKFFVKLTKLKVMLQKKGD